MQLIQRRLLAVAAGLLLGTGCGGDADPTAPEDPSAGLPGTYPLILLDGSPLPYLADQEGETTLHVTGGRVILRADSTFRDEVDLLLSEAGTGQRFQQSANGTWALSGNVVTFTSPSVETYTMTLAGDTLTQDVDGFVWVYRKQ